MPDFFVYFQAASAFLGFCVIACHSLQFPAKLKGVLPEISQELAVGHLQYRW
jgi:hypothetical protein